MTRIPKNIVIAPSRMYSHCHAEYPRFPASPLKIPAAIRFPKAPEIREPE